MTVINIILVYIYINTAQLFYYMDKYHHTILYPLSASIWRKIGNNSNMVTCTNINEICTGSAMFGIVHSLFVQTLHLLKTCSWSLAKQTFKVSSLNWISCSVALKYSKMSSAQNVSETFYHKLCDCMGGGFNFMKNAVLNELKSFQCFL